MWTPAAGSFPKKMSCSVPTGTIQNDKGKTCHVFFKQLFIFYADDTKLSDALSSSSSSPVTSSKLLLSVKLQLLHIHSFVPFAPTWGCWTRCTF